MFFKFWQRLFPNLFCKTGNAIKEKPLTPPIVWRAAVEIEEPSSYFTEQLSDMDKKRIQFIKQEAEFFSRLTSVFPTNINNDAWFFLLNCETRKQRLDHLIFLGKKEKLQWKEEQKAIERKLSAPEKEPLAWKTYINWNTARTTREEKRWATNRLVSAHILKDRPSLAVDCRFLEQVSPRAAQLTGSQLKYLVSMNRKKRNPWPIYFVNFDETGPSTSSVIKRHLSLLLDTHNLNCSPIITAANYTDIYPKEKIIYLSPHATEELTDLQEEDVLYVIGGIVDRVVEKGIHPHASKEAADKDGVRCAKFPLDQYVKWKSGTKYLTLIAVANILQTVHETGGDWEFALSQHIPVRNTRSSEEKSKASRDIHKRLRELNHQLLAIVNEKLPEPEFLNSRKNSL